MTDDAGERPRSYLIIVNPVAGSGDGGERARILAEGLPDDCEVRIVETEERGSAIEMAETHADQVDRIIAVGGDGTLNEALTGLMCARRSEKEIAALGFLPSGTANGAAKAFGFTDRPEVAACRLPTAGIREVDVGIVEHAGGVRPFLLRFGAGLDAAVMEELNTSRTGVMGFLGLLRNAVGIVRTLSRYTDPDIAITVDGDDFATAASVVLPNVAEVGLQAKMTEEPDPDDGKILVLAVSIPSKWSIVSLGLSMVFSSLQSAAAVRTIRGERVHLDSRGDVPFQLDGEPMGSLPVDVRLERRALRLLLT